jgi:hypothetical protein
MALTKSFLALSLFVGLACKNASNSGPQSFQAAKQLKEACEALKAWTPQNPPITLVMGDGTSYTFAAEAVTETSPGGGSSPLKTATVRTMRCVLKIENGRLAGVD